MKSSQVVVLPRQRDWKSVLSGSFRNLGELLDFCEIDPSRTAFNGRHDFPLRVTRYFASLIEKGNALDPLLLQVLPDAREFLYVDGYTEDAVGDQQAMPVPGLIHKYHGRVLLTLTGACAIHCRYCFRRHFPYSEANVDYNINGRVMTYLSGNPEVSEVILSGGDPLMVSDRKIANLISGLNSIPHVRVLRIHSRLLSVLPERVTEMFIETLQQFDRQIVFVTHINHPNEISTHNQSVFRLLSGQGYKLFNQSVLLKRVNDSAQTLVGLSNKLFASDIIPYYLHRLDKVQGAAHFDLSTQESCRIYQQLRNRLPGYLLPVLVEEVAGQSSKTPVHCN
ncbi:MAG: EF-P beta-lysylation protein EpmB [Lysobacterales bacterium]